MKILGCIRQQVDTNLIKDSIKLENLIVIHTWEVKSQLTGKVP